MIMTRLLIYLSDEEKTALQAIANREMRGLREQTRLIVRQELERRGLLVIETQADPVPVPALSMPAQRDQTRGNVNVT